PPITASTVPSSLWAGRTTLMAACAIGGRSKMSCILPPSHTRLRKGSDSLPFQEIAKCKLQILNLHFAICNLGALWAGRIVGQPEVAVFGSVRLSVDRPIGRGVRLRQELLIRRIGCHRLATGEEGLNGGWFKLALLLQGTGRFLCPGEQRSQWCSCGGSR